jgi:hypothetical protein
MHSYQSQNPAPQIDPPVLMHRIRPLVRELRSQTTPSVQHSSAPIAGVLWLALLVMMLRQLAGWRWQRERDRAGLSAAESGQLLRLGTSWWAAHWRQVSTSLAPPRDVAELEGLRQRVQRHIADFPDLRGGELLGLRHLVAAVAARLRPPKAPGAARQRPGTAVDRLGGPLSRAVAHCQREGADPAVKSRFAAMLKDALAQVDQPIATPAKGSPQEGTDRACADASEREEPTRQFTPRRFLGR